MLRLSVLLLAIGCAQEASAPLPAADAPLPELLSELGDFSPGASGRSDGERYTPRYPLYTDGSAKDRWLVVPADGEVTEADGSFDFPVGSYLFKTFSYDGAPVETRVMRLAEDGWDYAVYGWTGEDAALLDIAGPQDVGVQLAGNEQVHTIPSRVGCRSCHESNAPDEVIGLSPLQLGESRSALSALPAGDAVPPIEARTDDEAFVLAYFEGNCVHCHNGEAGPSRAFDLRANVALNNTVGAPTEASGIPEGLRVAPGSPDDSILLQLLRTEDGQGMPPLGVNVLDERAIARIAAWINNLEP